MRAADPAGQPIFGQQDVALTAARMGAFMIAQGFG
jgi:hypothetical protein